MFQFFFGYLFEDVNFIGVDIFNYYDFDLEKFVEIM